MKKSNVKVNGNVGFNTASGKHCCNELTHGSKNDTWVVSIPQAVSTVATFFFYFILATVFDVSIPQAVSTVATAGSRKPVFKRSQKVVLENLKP